MDIRKTRPEGSARGRPRRRRGSTGALVVLGLVAGLLAIPTTAAQAAPILQIVIQDTPDPAVDGGAIQYLVTISNVGDSPANLVSATIQGSSTILGPTAIQFGGFPLGPQQSTGFATTMAPVHAPRAELDVIVDYLAPVPGGVQPGQAGPATEYTEVLLGDSTPPTVTCWPPDGSYWYGGNVEVPCTAFDASGLRDTNMSVFSLFTEVPSGEEDAAAYAHLPMLEIAVVCDVYGNCTNVDPYGPYKVDRKAPDVTCGTADDLWHKGIVTIDCNATDGGVGYSDGPIHLAASLPPDMTDPNVFTNDVTVCDDLNNCTTAGPVGGNKIDNIAPTVTVTLSKDGPYEIDEVVDATFECSDHDSGMVGGFAKCPSPTTLDTTTAGYKTVTWQAYDAADNIGMVTVSYSVVDGSAPVVSCDPAPLGWSGSDVTIACTASDAGSGLADPGDASFTLTTSVPTGEENPNASTDSRSICDEAGNCATAGPVTGIQVDRKGPSISWTLDPAGADYEIGTFVMSSFTCWDGGSGVASCPLSQALDTTTAGPHSVPALATDNVGNAASKTFSYTVRQPSSPTQLGQYQGNGTSVIKVGGATKTPVVIKGIPADPDGETVQLQVEVKPTGTAFTGSGLLSSTIVASGTLTSVTFAATATGGYHWRARTIDSNGAVSPWVSFGNNPEASNDFKITGKII